MNTLILKNNTFLKSFILVVVAFSMQSCFVAKKYERPEIAEISDSLYRTNNLPTDSMSLAKLSWKDLFTDPVLGNYIEEGLNNNLDIRIALQNIYAAEAYLKQGKSAVFPTLDANASVGRNYLSKNGQQGAALSSLGVDHIDQFEVNAGLSWEADIWGKIKSNERALHASYLQTVAAHQAVKTKLIANIAASYYQLLALDSQLKITQETIEARKQSVETIKALKEAGQVTQVAVDQNVAQLNNAQAIAVSIERSIFKTENTLSILLGKMPAEVSRTSLSTQKIYDSLSVGVPALLLENRPDVRAAEFNLIQKFQLTNVAKSSFYPSITITARGGLQSFQLSDLFSSSSLFSNIIGGLTQPIFNGRKIKTQYEVAQAQQEQALLLFKQTLLTAGAEVSNALYEYQAETRRIQFLNNEVIALRSAEENSEILLNNGFGNYLDLLTARQSALNAELNVINSKLDRLLSVVNLYEALGGGWQ